MRSPSPNEAYIATFHTHFGALTFHKKLKGLGDNAVMMPVPRKLSASCGTCVQFSLPFDPAWADEDLEAVYLHADGNYRLLFENEES
ncbi:DUF3343 domain-containing protein [uncultured Flavonifractor sp.]|uniref:DUF3343 domain-containing protein n=1 Tax=uncultured Flavonifractor sp. TaxID=1193534 RepID=UPI002625B918|nr:DUF3343 domain-containing protein [uncultured Flavonifractor sp.]